MIRAETATVVEKREQGRSHVRLRLRAPRIARESLPGQFVNVRCTPASFPETTFDDFGGFLAHRRGILGEPKTLLMRPFAVYRRWIEGPKSGQIEILFKVIGRGTEALAAKRPGDKVELLGPLGKGFDLDWCRGLSTAAVVAGGVGVAPLYPLVKFLREQDVRTLVIVGVLSEDDMPVAAAEGGKRLSFMATEPEVALTAEEFERLGCEVGIVTLEGDRGYVGLPTDMLDCFLHSSAAGTQGETGVFTCGPWGMMREVARHAAEHNVRCQALLEERMGCGVGACMGCTCRTKSAGGRPVRKRICIEGPVFDANEVVWNEE